MDAITDVAQRSPRFEQALTSLRRARFQPALHISEIPTSSALAPHGISLAADVVDPLHGNEDLAVGRFVLLHDPRSPEAWDGTFRIVTYIRARVEVELASEAMLNAVAWDWIMEALEQHDARHTRAGGTATRQFSTGLGTLDGNGERAEIELRASWSPQPQTPGADTPDMQRHLEAWQDILCHYAGIPPLPEGVARIGRSRSRKASWN